MKKIAYKSISIILSFVLCFVVFIGANAPVNAATVDYVYSGTYIKNWGTREEVATFMSPKATAFYQANGTTFEELIALSGSSSASNVPSSALYKELQQLMKSNHDYETSYNATRDLFKHTDCQNSAGAISSFYSGKSIGPNWDSGKTWNREHTWPNSKGDASGNGENDIMMLRPASVSENSSRGNKAYGQSSGYYNPNGESGGKYDLRGDVARIILYQYVRWNCTNTGSGYNPTGIFGTDGVIESATVMLDWIEQDPVDTWELGRNDSVESITGTRNVFVDYPELAFTLFGKQVPSDYTTPSGSASDGIPDVPVTPGEPEEPAEPTLKVVENPKAGTAYKFGMVQNNVSTTDIYFIKGGMAATYYLDTSNNIDLALDVYLQETTGGYYLYTMISGAKKYINMVVSGTHVNSVYETSASTVYTYDTTLKTLVSVVNSKEYVIGTRNDKSYTTVGPVAVSSNGFYCQLYTMSVDIPVESGSTGDINGDGNVNNKDLGRFMQYLNGWNVTISLTAADVNGDGNVNNKDYGILMQYANGWNVTIK